MKAVVSLLLFTISYLHVPIPAGAQINNGNFDLPGLPGLGLCNAGNNWQFSPFPKLPEYTAYPTLANWHIDLTPCHVFGNGSWIEQTVTTTPGDCYQLQVDLGSICGWDASDAGVYLFVNGQQTGTRIYNDTFICLPDTVCWKTRYSTVFTTTGNTTTIRLVGEGRLTVLSPSGNPGDIGNPGYIGVDNVKLLPGGSNIQQDSLVLGPDTIACLPLTLTANVNATSYEWSTGETSQSVIISAPGVYWVKGTTPCVGHVVDTIYISGVPPPLVTLPDQIAICAGDTVNLVPVTSNVSSFVWSTGETTMQIEINSPGQYWLSASNTCGISTDTVNVMLTQVPHVELPDELRLCSDILSITADTINSSSVIWSTGETTVNINVAQPGTYWIKAENTCGYDIDAVVVIETATASINMPDELSLCGKSVLIVTPSVKHTNYFLWSTGEKTQSITIDKQGVYWLEIGNECITIVDSIMVSDCESTIWIPSAFSPNSDGNNDALNVKSFNSARLLALYIFDRWGEQVFYTNDIRKGWDGMYKGKPMPVGTYYYSLEYTNRRGEHVSLKSGDIALIR